MFQDERAPSRSPQQGQPGGLVLCSGPTQDRVTLLQVIRERNHENVMEKWQEKERIKWRLHDREKDNAKMSFSLGWLIDMHCATATQRSLFLSWQTQENQGLVQPSFGKLTSEILVMHGLKLMRSINSPRTIFVRCLQSPSDWGLAFRLKRVKSPQCNYPSKSP
jgi:hypothetical protein